MNLCDRCKSELAGPNMCRARECGGQIGENELFCRSHWMDLPSRTRERLTTTEHHRNQERFEALSDAIIFLALSENR